MARKRRLRGEGSIFYSDAEGTWVAKIKLPDGRERRKRNKSKVVVQEWLFNQRKAISENRPLIRENTTFNQFADQFLSDVAKHTLEDKTFITYESYLRLHIRPDFGSTKLTNITPQAIQSLYTKKLKSGLSKKTVHHIHATLRRVLNEAVKKELLYKNPCDAVTPPRVEKKAPAVWTVEESREFLKAVEGDKYYGIYLIALTTGCRRGEILGMEWQNINWRSGTISIEKAIVEVKGKAIITTPKTKKSRRRITLPEVVLDLLKENRKTSGWIFPSERGTPMSPRNLLRHYYSVLDGLDLPRIRFHDMRHTAATILLQQDVHPKLVQELLGHASIVQTYDTYSHVIQGVSNQTAEEMDKIFK